LVEQFEQFITI